MTERSKQSPWVVVAGAAALLVAIGASGTLAMDHLGAFSAPGCGGNSDCHTAAKGFWGSIRLAGVNWPVSFLGASYFLAMLGAWLLSRGEPGGGVRWVSRLGALGSLFFIGVMIVEKLFCPYCFVTHIANLAFTALCQVAGRGARPSFGRGAIAALGAFVVATGALAAVESETAKAAGEKSKGEFNDSVAEMIRRAKANKPAPKAPEQPAAQPAAPQPPPIALPSIFTGRYRWGPEVAPIRIVMFTGYQCPDCKKIEPQIEELLAKRNDISVSIKHFPFCPDCNRHVDKNMQPNGCWAARAAEAAGILKGADGFKKMHEWLFARGGAFTNDDLMKVLAEFGWDAARFTQEMQGPTTLRNVQTDVEEAVSLGLHYTPFIFINGVELHGWNVPNSVTNAVDLLTQAEPTPAGPDSDHPPQAGDKFVADWRDPLIPAMDWPKRAQPYELGVPYANAKVHIQVFGDLLEPNTAEADKIIREAIAGRADINYQFRYFPIDKSCNPALPKTLFPLGCRAARAAEAAGQLGGTDAYWKMHLWLEDHRNGYSDPLAKAQAAAMGLNADEFMKKLDSPDVDKLVSLDADIGKRIGIPEVPRIFINGKVLPRWKLPGQFVIERVIEEAAQPEHPAK